MQTRAGEMWLPIPAKVPKVSPREYDVTTTVCDFCVWQGACREQVSLGNFCGCEDVLPQEKLDYLPPSLPEEGIGYCECGCGGLAPIAKCNRKNRGLVKGKPKRFINGHSRRGKTYPR